MEWAKTAIKKLVARRLIRADNARRMHIPGGHGGLPPELWGLEAGAGGKLRMQGHCLADLANEFDTPVHLIDLQWLRKSHDAFIRAFRSQIPTAALATSYKTNPVPIVLQTLHGLGTYAEVISEFELWLAGRLGLDGDRIIVNGPGKTPSMLARAVDVSARIINIDGRGEIAAIAREAQRVGRPQRVGVRIVTSVGWSSQFGLGIATGDALRAFQDIRQDPWLIANGLHLHIGTGLKSVESYLTAIRELVAFAGDLKRLLDIDLGIIDLGGGFGVPTVRGTDSWDDRMVALGYPAREALPGDCPRAGDYAERIAKLLASLPGQKEPPVIVFEPGRAITSSAQTLLLRVVAVKETGAARQLILDGGKNIAMPLGWETHKIFPVEQLDRPFGIRTDLFGPLCHPGDVIARHLALPKLAVGDVLAIMDAGAYFIPNQMNFSNPRPAIIALDNGATTVARRRESFEDIVRLDEVP